MSTCSEKEEELRPSSKDPHDSLRGRQSKLRKSPVWLGALHRDKSNGCWNLPADLLNSFKRHSSTGNTVQYSRHVTTQGGVVMETALKAPWQSQGIIKASDGRTASRVVSMETIKHTFSQAQQLFWINDSLYRFKNIVNGSSIASFVRQCLVKRAVRDPVLLHAGPGALSKVGSPPLNSPPRTSTYKR